MRTFRVQQCCAQGSECGVGWRVPQKTDWYRLLRSRYFRMLRRTRSLTTERKGKTAYPNGKLQRTSPILMQEKDAHFVFVTQFTNTARITLLNDPTGTPLSEVNLRFRVSISLPQRSAPALAGLPVYGPLATLLSYSLGQPALLLLPAAYEPLVLGLGWPSRCFDLCGRTLRRCVRVV
jgi:hypothetical protein